MEDEKGRDEKLLAVAINDPCHNNIFKKGDISPHILEEISVFFQTYKMSEKTKWVKVYEWSNEEETITLVRETHNAFSRKNQKTLSSERIPRDISVISLGFDYME
jgi:inorganic pyrophosphatase